MENEPERPYEAHTTEELLAKRSELLDIYNQAEQAILSRSSQPGDYERMSNAERTVHAIQAVLSSRGVV